MSVSDGVAAVTPTISAFGELDAIDMEVGAAAPWSWALTRDNAGRITTKTEVLGAATSAFSYTYDNMSRLDTVTRNSSVVEDYDYDARGRRIADHNGRHYFYDDEDKLLEIEDGSGNTLVAYTYDLDGFLAQKVDASGVTDYVYNAFGELEEVVLPNNDRIGYVYDPSGLRIAKRVNGAITEKYLWAGRTGLLAVFNPNNSLRYRFVYTGGHLPVAVETATDTYYLAYDQVGSLRGVIDDTGAIVRQISYDSFGNVLTDSTNDPAVADIPIGYAGGLHDTHTGLTLFGYRDYDPATGRWLAKDPIGFGGGDNDLYAYVWNDPINLSDPIGLGGFGDALLGFVGGTSGDWVDQALHVGTSFGRGVVQGVVGAGVIVGAAAGAVAIGVPTAVVVGGVGIIAVVGSGLAISDIALDPSLENFAEVAGGLVGGAAVGGVSGRYLGRLTDPNSTRFRNWSIRRDLEDRFRPELGTVWQWLSSGFSEPVAGTCLTFGGLLPDGAADTTDSIADLL